MTRKTAFFKGWSWFKFNNLGLALGTNLKFYTSLLKGLNLKVRKVWGLIPTFVEVTGEKLEGGLFAPPPPILNMIKITVLHGPATSHGFHLKNTETFMYYHIVPLYSTLFQKF